MGDSPREHWKTFPKRRLSSSVGNRTTHDNTASEGYGRTCCCVLWEKSQSPTPKRTHRVSNGMSRTQHLGPSCQCVRSELKVYMDLDISAPFQDTTAIATQETAHVPGQRTSTHHKNRVRSCERSLRLSLVQGMDENHRQGERRGMMGPSDREEKFTQDSEDHFKLQHAEALQIRAIQGHSVGAAQPHFFTPKVLGKG